jgi:hypothetical protein
MFFFVSVEGQQHTTLNTRSQQHREENGRNPNYKDASGLTSTLHTDDYSTFPTDSAAAAFLSSSHSSTENKFRHKN